MNTCIRIAMLDDHQGILDGYAFRLSGHPDIEIVGMANYGEDLAPLLARAQVEVLILDVHVPTSAENSNPYPMLHLIPKILQSYPDLQIIVISQHNERALIQAVMEAGASGYILKDDHQLIRDLANVVRDVVAGDIRLSTQAEHSLRKQRTGLLEQPLSARQIQALSLSAAYPDDTNYQLAKRMNIANSTMRNLLSAAYLKLGVRNRPAAINRARQMGLLTDGPQIDIQTYL